MARGNGLSEGCPPWPATMSEGGRGHGQLRALARPSLSISCFTPAATRAILTASFISRSHRNRGSGHAVTNNMRGAGLCLFALLVLRCVYTRLWRNRAAPSWGEFGAGCLLWKLLPLAVASGKVLAQVIIFRTWYHLSPSPSLSHLQLPDSSSFILILHGSQCSTHAQHGSHKCLGRDSRLLLPSPFLASQAPWWV